MHVLLIKTSSMGDVIHTLPALTDAGKAIPGIQFDWMVEDSFAEIPAWHPLVKNVIPVSFRHWRKEWFSRGTWCAWRAWRHQLQARQYDKVLDAQGLIKSAFLAFFAKGERVGLDFHSAREPLASLCYQRKVTVNFYQHAVVRMRLLFSQALGYSFPSTPPDFGLDRPSFVSVPSVEKQAEKYLVFLHGTTWATKQWPEVYWKRLAVMAAEQGYRIKISGGNEEEAARAKRIASASNAVEVLPRLSIGEMAVLLVSASAAVAVDTGLGHLAGALGVPTVSIYGPTNPAYTGALGQASVHLAAVFSCSPCLSRTCTYRAPSAVTPACYTTVTPEQVWAALFHSHPGLLLV